MSEYMIFCLEEDKFSSKGAGYQKNYQIFNKDVSHEKYSKAIISRPSFILPISIWRKEEDMTKEEKKEVSNWSQMGGYMKVLSYKDAWAYGWKNASKEFKNWVKNLPNFDAGIFEKITGQKFNDASLSGKKVEVKIDGTTYSATID